MNTVLDFCLLFINGKVGEHSLFASLVFRCSGENDI